MTSLAVPIPNFEPMVVKAENTLKSSSRVAELCRRGNRISILIRGTTNDPQGGQKLPTKEHIADFWIDNKAFDLSKSSEKTAFDVSELSEKKTLDASELQRWVFEAYGKQIPDTVRELAQLVSMDIARHYGIKVYIITSPIETES